jgi:hypothetical protein
VTLCGTSVGVASDATSSCTPSSDSSRPSGLGSLLGVDLATVFLPVTACGNSAGVLGDAATSCGDAATPTESPTLATPTAPTAPSTPTTPIGPDPTASAAVGARIVISDGPDGFASAAGRVDAASGALGQSASDGSALPTTGIAIAGTLAVAGAFAGLGALGRFAARRHPAPAVASDVSPTD